MIDRHHTIGHTFFMEKSLDPKRLAAIWDRKIGPLLDEYFFDRPDLAAYVQGQRLLAVGSVRCDLKQFKKSLGYGASAYRGRSKDLEDLGKRLTSNTTWWGETEEEDGDTPRKECHPCPEHA